MEATMDKPVQKVVVVNGNTEVMDMLKAVLDDDRYDMVFVENEKTAYSEIRRVKPNLVILCTTIDELSGLQVLTMLKLDAETRDIPVLTYASRSDNRDFEQAIASLNERDELPLNKPHQKN
jgi:two-component system phosphate regulon response regulator PhoB